MLDIREYIQEKQRQINKHEKKKSQKTKVLIHQLWGDIRSHLLENNNSFKELDYKNLSLLSGKELVFKVVATDRAYASSHAKKMNGKMLPNGRIFAETTKLNFWDFDFFPMYPTQFTGQLNGLAEVELIASRRGVAIIGSKLPNEFSGVIHENGTAQLEITDWYYELTGKMYITKMMGHPFRGYPSEKAEFILNRKKMISMMREFKKECIT